jgi:hypothetical protein
MTLPFPGGRVRFYGTNNTRYNDGRHAWRCAGCGKVGPWQDGWGWYGSALQEDDGVFADHGRGYPVWCGSACMQVLIAAGECSSAPAEVRVTRKGRR